MGKDINWYLLICLLFLVLLGVQFPLLGTMSSHVQTTACKTPTSLHEGPFVDATLLLPEESLKSYLHPISPTSIKTTPARLVPSVVLKVVTDCPSRIPPNNPQGTQQFALP